MDANRLARELGLGNHANMILQAAFFKLSGVMPVEDAVRHMKEAVKDLRQEGRKGGQHEHGRRGRRYQQPCEGQRSRSWANTADDRTVDESLPDVVKNIVIPCNRQRGDDLPVSAFLPYQDGTYPLGTSKYDKRGIAAFLPQWDQQQVPAVQPVHLCLPPCRHPGLPGGRGGGQAAPAGFTMVDAKGAGPEVPPAGQHLDCTGCGSCAASCLAKDKALTMQPVDDTMYDETNWNYALSLSDKPGVFDRKTLKGSQFSQPLVEFSGACAGCGETPYAKLITQLYGEKTYWVNGVGCSLAWAGIPVPALYQEQGGPRPCLYGTSCSRIRPRTAWAWCWLSSSAGPTSSRWLQLLPLVPGTELETAINAGCPPSTIWMPTMPMPAS